ncbi:unnamed protein product, partial [Heligmosomoides polygyrus]|uniref:GCP_C_terminal domain-containing protein n=1 Tax=Heligmosomoides polygyrus TaxID=6339 RepID=A0A183FAE9_HELPZ
MFSFQILSSISVRRCLRKPVVNPAEDEASKEAASSRNLPHAADEEDSVEGQLRQPGKFLRVPPMLPQEASRHITNPSSKGGQGSIRSRAASSSPREEPAQVGATGQETAREEPTSAADYPRYQELLALLQIRLNTGAPSDNSATAAQSSAASSSDARSTHQLTETGFRTVFDYININNLLRPSIAALKIPVKEVTASRRADYESVARIVEQHRSMQELSTTTTQRIHNLGVLMTRADPLQFRYTVLMGWIHELVHSIALLNDYTYQLNHITVPRLLDWADDRDYFRATLQLFRVTERTISDVIQFASAVVAHAIRMIRVVEAHQLLLVLHGGVGVITNDDQQYAVDSSLPIPEPISTNRFRIEETLQWWSENYSNALMVAVTDGYLRTHSVDQFL